MQHALTLLPVLVLSYFCLMTAFVILLAAPHGKVRRFLMLIVGSGFAALAVAYCLEPADAMPKSFIDDFGVLIGGLAAIVAANDAGKPDENEPQ